MNAHAQEDWGAEKNQWLVDLSYGTAGLFAAAFLLGMLFLFRAPLLRTLSYPLRPFAPALNILRVLIIFTPLRAPLRRYLYIGRHLANA
jgi:hypothetical protein